MKYEKLLSPHELVERWCGTFCLGTLANWRSKGVGPTYMKLRGRVVYPLTKIEAWEAENTHP
ncbi:conserved hypothetical protein [Novosphingobium sp. KN65.2]|nr:conserved hypothetical protein [Novosphingobium sp. KN65.2]